MNLYDPCYGVEHFCSPLMHIQKCIFLYVYNCILYDEQTLVIVNKLLVIYDYDGWEFI